MSRRGGTLGGQFLESFKDPFNVEKLPLVGGFFAPPAKPKLPGVTQPPAVPASDGTPPTRAEIERRARQRRGAATTPSRSGTLLTGPQGVPFDTSATRTKTLLGL